MDELDKALQQLEHFRDLPPDWDGYGGRPIDPIAIDTARVVVTALRGIFVAPLSDGGVDLECLSKGCIFGLSIHPDGEIEVYVQGPNLERDWRGRTERREDRTTQAAKEEEGRTAEEASGDTGN